MKKLIKILNLILGSQKSNPRDLEELPTFP